jgi:vancomycin resistance protein YoaR
MRTILKILAALALLSILAVLSLLAYDYLRTREAFPPKTFIAGVDLSLLNREKALARLENFSVSQLFSPLITLEVEAAPYSFAPEKLGIVVLYKESIQKGFEITHRGSYLEHLKERITKEALVAPLVLGIHEEQLKAVLEALADEIRTAPEDASMTFYEKGGGYNIKPHTVGKEVNIQKSVAQFEAFLYEGKKTIPLVIDYTDPRIKEEDLRAHPPVYRLSAYTTYYGSHDSPNRIHNIKLISSWMDGTLVMPGDSLSVTEILGDVTEEQGFKEAFVIVKGELVPLLGGGACQIATTLYNAVSLADLKVLERRNHSFYFNIYPLGRDAGVYPEQLDFKFENDSPYPILIKTAATDRGLSFKLYGTPNGKKVKFSSAKVYGRSDSDEYIPMSLSSVIEQDIPFKTEVVRTVFDKNGKPLKEETILSRYKLYGDKENVPIKRPEPR